jgi:hypothetical protein
MTNMTASNFSPAARWIWGSDDPSPQNVWRYFRRQFTVPANLSQAALLITADSRYEGYLNGAYIGRGPMRGFPFAYRYDVYDITAYLTPGNNTLAALVNYLGDHTMTYIKGATGFLAEIILEDATGGVTHIVSDAGWRTAICPAFATHVPRISVQLDFEEQVDARRDIPGWNISGFDDSGWRSAVEVGPVGCAPWTTLTPRTIPFLTEDPVQPTQIKAVELARARPGYLWHLDVRDPLGTVRTGLRTAPPGERGSILFTEVIAARDCTVRVHIYPDYETVEFRANDQTFGDRTTVLDNPEAPTDVHLKAGANLFMLRNVEWPTLLFETNEPLQFTGERFVPGAAWVVTPGLNELTGELQQRWSVQSLDELPASDKRIGIPASANRLDIFALTASQEFFAADGGFCTHDITRATPRPRLDGARARLVDAPDALLHDTPNWTTVYPQPDADVHIVVDFGREMIGYPQLEIDAPDGAIIDANFFEGIDDGGIFWTRNLKNSFRYVCREGGQVFTSHQRRGFRYGSFTFRNLSRPLKIRHIHALMATYPVVANGRFACSDETLTKIWQVGAYTVQLCMLDTYVDCPAYEQVFWVGDARNSALVNAIAFGAFDLTDHCIRLNGQSLSEELKQVKPPHIQAMRTHITTSHTVSGWFDEIPMWTFLWIWTAWEQYWLTGDRDALAAYYADIRECLRRCETFLTERGLFDLPDTWNLVDWAAQDLERDGEVISNTALMAQALDYAAQMADDLNRPDEAAHHRGVAQRLRAAVNQYGWSEQYQGYVDTVRDAYAYQRYQALCAQQGIAPVTFDAFQQKQRISEPTNTLVLLCNAVPPERHEAVMQLVLNAKTGQFVGSSPWMARFGKPDEIVPVGSPWFLFFTLETLFKYGLVNDGLTILREQWNRMLEKGATTFWETFPGFIGAGHWSRSLCHGWSAAPAYFLTTQVLGVTAAAPGYKRIRIAPQPFNLRWASGTVPTPHGPISVSWKLNTAGQMEITYDAPAGCAVEVVQPTL